MTTAGQDARHDPMPGERYAGSDAWTAQAPPADFASRVLSAALVERGEAKTRRRMVRRALVACAMAAVLVAGAAWGFTAWRERTVSAAHPVSASVVVMTEAPIPPAPVAPPVSAAPSASAPPPVVPVLPPLARPVPRRKHVDSAPDAGRRVLHPSCDCSPHDEYCLCY
jgi:hypothetical protein